MNNSSLKTVAGKFRKAIEAAYAAGEFLNDFSFNDFPNGCCGDTSYLLAEYLRQYGVKTIWVSIEREDWTHAWLVVNDDKVSKPKLRDIKAEIPDDILQLLNSYGSNIGEQDEEDVYTYDDIKNGTIVDITSDQFDDYKNISVYVGQADEFHKSFEFREAIDSPELQDPRLERLYSAIMRYIDE